jgi:hypothetical protein
MVQNFGVKMQTMQELIEGTKNAGADFGVSMDEQFAVLGTLSRTLGTESSGIYEQFLRSAPAAAQKLGMSFVDATENAANGRHPAKIAGQIRRQH